MTRDYHISFIVPVYNRPEEVEDLLHSMLHLQRADHLQWDLHVVEDGSQVNCREVVARYQDRLPVHYHWQENTGPSGARNRGAKEAAGEYFVFLDSDTLLPPQYLQQLEASLQSQTMDLFGGPDRSMSSFSPLQRAIDFSMTSFLTTGGIRGRKGKRLDVFYPRTFNMGVSKVAFEAVKGFGALRFGEDLDFSMRVLEAGYHSALYPEVWLYHKRRSSWRPFFKQVYNSGIARINLNLLHPGSLKPVHLLPSLFVLGHLVLLLLSLLFRSAYPLLPIPLYLLLIFITAGLQYRSLKVGLLACVSCYLQLFGYGLGFLHAWWQRYVRKKGLFTQFEKHFYQ